MAERAIDAVLFDIDGTLLVTGGAGAVAWQRAFEELHGVEADIDEHTDAGMTDPEIAAIVFREVLGREGTPAGAGAGDRLLPQAPARRRRRVGGLPGDAGGRGAAARLIERGVLLGLVTGNVEAAAHIKLARGHLNRFFSFGGYGSDSADRVEVTKAALRRAELVSGGTLADGACIAVGDTPRDVSRRPRRRHPRRRRSDGQLLGRPAQAKPGADWALEQRSRRGFPALGER